VSIQFCDHYVKNKKVSKESICESPLSFDLNFCGNLNSKPFYTFVLLSNPVSLDCIIAKIVGWLMKCPSHTNAHKAILAFTCSASRFTEFSEKLIEAILPVVSGFLKPETDVATRGFGWSFLRIARSSELEQKMDAAQLQCFHEIDRIASSEYGGDIKIARRTTNQSDRLSNEHVLAALRSMTLGK
jgi:hypothetical protein